MLAGGKYPNVPLLADHLEVHERTVRRDLDFLRTSCQAPIACCRRRNGFYYTAPGYTLPIVRLTQGELVALFLAEAVLHQCRGTPYEADLRRAVEKLALALPDEVCLDPAEFTAALSVTPTVVTPQDVIVFASLTAAVASRERLELTYWTAERDEVTTRRVDPYQLNLRAGEWFLIGFCHLRQAVRMFAPQRVRGLCVRGNTSSTLQTSTFKPTSPALSGRFVEWAAIQSTCDSHHRRRVGSQSGYGTPVSSWSGWLTAAWSCAWW
jgi:predicted DNA-binding transcriptional regulator YafY